MQGYLTPSSSISKLMYFLEGWNSRSKPHCTLHNCISDMSHSVDTYVYGPLLGKPTRKVTFCWGSTLLIHLSHKYVLRYALDFACAQFSNSVVFLWNPSMWLRGVNIQCLVVPF